MLLLPALTIHTAVKQAKKAFVNVSNPRLKSWGPTATGLSIVPVLPYLFDKPVEHATDFAFEWVEKKLIESQNTRAAATAADHSHESKNTTRTEGKGDP